MSDFKDAVKNHRKYEENFQGLLKLPVVLRLKRKNARLIKELRELEKKYKELLEKFAGIRGGEPQCGPTEKPVKIKQEPKAEEIIVCDQVKKNEEEYEEDDINEAAIEEEVEIVVCDQIKNNIQIVLEEVDECGDDDISEAEEGEEEEVDGGISEAEEEEVEGDIIEAEEEEVDGGISEAEEEEVEGDVKGGISEAEESEEEEVDGGISEAEEEEVENEGDISEEAEEEEEDAEVYEVTINKKTYYVTNETDSIIYDLDENGDISVEVGKYKNGKPIFNS